jgi:hypothetical protein
MSIRRMIRNPQSAHVPQGRSEFLPLGGTGNLPVAVGNLPTAILFVPQGQLKRVGRALRCAPKTPFRGCAPNSGFMPPQEQPKLSRGAHAPRVLPGASSRQVSNSDFFSLSSAQRRRGPGRGGAFSILHPLSSILIFIALFVFTALHTRADDSSFKSLEVSVQREPINCVVPVFRAFVNVGSQKFTLLIPEDFHTGGDPAHGRFEMANTEGNCIVTFSIMGPTDSAIDTDAYREMLKLRYPGAKILGEFAGSAGSGENGPGFDIQWKGAAGLLQKTRVAFLSTPAGVVQVVATSGANKFGLAISSFNEVISSLRCSDKDGKLIVYHISDRS